MICEEQQCVYGCRKDADCDSEMICEEQRCIYGRCREDADCDPNEICNESNQCECPNESCSQTLCCLEDEACYDGRCVSMDLTWVSIPAGSFEMGCSPGYSDCSNSEEPCHPVNVPAFKMTETEITQSQYEEATVELPSSFSGCPDCPVESITWYDAKEFCEGIGGRLPSEAEWEYAARAGTTTRYYCGDDASCLDDIAWYGENSDDKTHPVAQKDANNFGLYDMFGNVYEWNEDCWHYDYNDAPNDGEAWEGGNCDSRVLRGSYWGGVTWYLRASYRYWYYPDGRGSSSGFRCAR